MAIERSMISRLVLIAGVLLTVVVLGYLLLFETKDTLTLPQSLGGVGLTRSIQGDEASKYINKLHGKRVTPTGNIIGLYQSDGGNVTLYISLFDSEEHSAFENEKMRQLIEQGHPVFGHYRMIEIEGRKVSFCLGMNQVHYFFSDGVSVYWLEADVNLASDALHELLMFISGKGTRKKYMSVLQFRLKLEEHFSTFALQEIEK